MAQSEDPRAGEAAESEVPDAGELGRSEAALLGGTWFDDTCTFEERAFLRQAMILGRTVAQSRGLAACVSHVLRHGTGVTSAYPRADGCRKDPFSHEDWDTIVEGVVDVIRGNNAVRIECHPSENSTAGRDQHDHDYSGAEVMRIHTSPKQLGVLREQDPERSFVERIQPLASRASLVWHEAMHAHGYRHCGDHGGYFNDVPVIVQRCMLDVAKASARRCDMQRSCGRAARLAIVDDYPVTDDTGCECVRDALGSPLSTAEEPVSPRFDDDEPGDALGAALASGDFDGDGFDDLAVGAPGEQRGRGRVFLYVGTVFGLYPLKMLDGSGFASMREGDAFGSLLEAQDLNGDGRSELVVRASGMSGGRGRTLVYEGTDDGLFPVHSLAVRELRSAKTSYAARLTGFTSAMGDFDADGFVDYVLGTPNVDERSGGFVEFRWDDEARRYVTQAQHREDD